MAKLHSPHYGRLVSSGPDTILTWNVPQAIASRDDLRIALS
jgi:hypothetical protein